MIRKNISDGVSVFISEDNSFKTDFIAVNIMLPLRSDDASQNALLCYVLKAGSNDFPSIRALNSTLGELYGAILSTSVKKMGEVQVLSFTLEFIKNEFSLGDDVKREALSLLAGIILRPFIEEGGFCKTILAQEKKNLADYIAAQINDKRSYALIRCYELMCKNEPFGINSFGDIDTISKIDGVSLYRHYINVLDTADIAIYAKGSFTFDDIGNAFSALARGRKPVNVTTKSNTFKVAALREITERFPVNQGKLTIGFRTDCDGNSDNLYALIMMNCIYGGCTTSKLFNNVREKMSLCYYCSSFLEKHKGLMMVNSGVDEENRDVAQKEILNQLDDIRKGNFTDDEMESALKYLTNIYMSMRDSYHQSMNFTIGEYLLSSDRSPEDYIRGISAVTRQEIITAAKKTIPDMVYFIGSESEKEV